MTADILREAAAKMRERAEVWEHHSSPWRIKPGPAGWSEIRSAGVIYLDGEEVVHDTYVCQMDTTTTAEHIASWHPAVALAVADLLDLAATHQVAFTPVVRPLLVTVARAYLGRDA